jgi:hypothetical protein|tara:strand:+ start:3937 stop:4683 length:747 start_codon:yes stop_codon:yes gene_type:complete
MRRLIILLFILSASCSTEDDAICSTFTPKASDQYVFPVRPGMPEWAEFTSGQEMTDALQVPEGVLKSMSSYGLVETCFDYPLLANMMAFDTIQYGVERQMENFNGFHELVTRPDAGRIMLARFKQTNVECIPEGDEIIVGKYTLTFAYTGMVQAQAIFIEQLTSSERRELLDEAVIKYNQMVLIGDPYSIFNLKIEAVLMARVMITEEYEPFLKEIAKNTNMEIFVEHVELNNELETLNTILDYANQF